MHPLCHCHTLLIAQSTTPEAFGASIATLAFFMLVFAGIVKCIQIMRRPKTNTPCVLSLTFFLTAWLISPIPKSVVGESSAAYLPVAVVVWLTFFCLIVASLVLGIIGLMQYAKGKADNRWVQGKAQAIWGLVLSGLMFVAIGCAFMVGIAKELSKQVPATAAAGSVGTFESTEYNFRLTAPQSVWVSINTDSFSKDAEVCFRRTRPELFCFVIPELIGLNSDIDLDYLLEMVKANLKSVSSRTTFHSARIVRVAGVDGYRITADATIENIDFFYDYWITVNNGYAYQLVTTGKRSNQSEIIRSAKQFRDGFELIDPNKEYDIPTHAAIRSLESPEIGVSFDLSNGAWQVWDQLEDDVWYAGTGSLLGSTGGLAVVTIPLEGITPSERDLTSVLLSTYNFEYPSQTLHDAGPVEVTGASGFAFDTQRVIDGIDFTYHIHILKNDYRAYMVVGYTSGNRDHQLGMIRDVMSRARISRPPYAKQHNNRLAEVEADLLNQLGLRAYDDGRYEQAEQSFRSAMESFPGDAQYAENVIAAMEKRGSYQDTVAFAQKHLDDYQESESYQAYYAYLLGQSKQTYPQAVERYAKVFATGYQDEVYFDDYIQTLRALERPDEALTALDDYKKKHGGRGFTSLRAWALTDLERYDEAEQVLLKANGSGPYNENLMTTLAEVYIYAGRNREAVTLTEELIEKGFGNARVYYAKGDAEVGLAWYRRAKLSLTKSYELYNDADTKDYLDYVSGMLGEGDNTLVRKPLEPVAIPDAVERALEQIHARPWHAPDSIDAYDLSLSTGYHYEADQPLRTTFRRVIKINNRAGVDRFSTLTFDFDAQAESMFVNAVEVRDPEGNLIAQADIEASYVVDTNQDEMGTDDKTLTVPVPGLAPGYELSFVVTTESKGDYDSFPFIHDYALAYQPRKLWLCYVTGDTDSIAHQQTGGYELIVESADTLAWAFFNPPVYLWEYAQPRLGHWFNTLTLNDSAGDWPTLAQNYLEKIEHRLGITQPVAELSKQHADPSQDPAQVADRLASYVRDHISYTAIEFGTRGRTPNPTDLTLSNKYGDCKDQALLLWQLLLAADIKAHLALVNTDGDIVPQLPSMDQFDHMVVYVPEINNGQFIDCTSKYAPCVGRLPRGLANMPIFILDPDNPRFVQTGLGPTAENRIESDSKLTISATGDVTVQQTLTLAGWRADSMRAYLEPDRPDERLRNLQSLMQSYETLALTDLEIQDLNNLNKPLIINMTYRIAGVFDPVDGHMIGRLPALWERYYFEPEAMASRTSPFELGSHLTFVSSTSVTAANDWQIETAPPQMKLDTPYFTHSHNQVFEDKSVSLHSTTVRIPGKHPPQDYSKYSDAVSQMLRGLRGPVRLSPTEPGS